MFPRRAILVVGVIVALVLGGGAAVASGHVVVSSGEVPDAGTTLYETATTGFSYTNRSYGNVPTSTSISLTFFDADQGSPHTFTLLDIPDFWIQNYSTFNPYYLDQLLQKYGTLVNTTAVTTAHGGYANGTFTSPSAAGYYEFLCLESGHLQSGMYGIIAFGEPVPTNISFGSGSPGPGLAVFIIVGTIVALTVLAIVLGFVVGRRRGSEHEMPPERLGYPEPPGSEPLSPSPPNPPKMP